MMHPTDPDDDDDGGETPPEDPPVEAVDALGDDDDDGDRIGTFSVKSGTTVFYDRKQRTAWIEADDSIMWSAEDAQ